MNEKMNMTLKRRGPEIDPPLFGRDPDHDPEGYYNRPTRETSAMITLYCMAIGAAIVIAAVLGWLN